MKNFKYIADEIYEFFDEIIGSIIPGLYFCSYPILIIAAFFVVFKGLENVNLSFLGVFIFAISYVLGTMFRRSNSREPDQKSAKYIYYKSCPKDDNDYAFARLIPDDEYNYFIKSFISFANDNNLKYNKSLIDSRYRKIDLLKSKLFFVPKYHYFRSKPYVQKYVFDLLNKKVKRLNRTYKIFKIIKLKTAKNDESNNTIDLIKQFIDDFHLKEYCEFSVDYPYDNLKNYLIDRNMEQLSEYIGWEYKDLSLDDKSKDYSCEINSKETENISAKSKRSKSALSNKKIEIRHISFADYGQLLKTEAHIRFMNAMWYSNKFLARYSIPVVLTFTFLYWFFYGQVGLFKEYFSRSYYNPRLCLIITSISVIYLYFSFIIKKTIKNNFHYQRIREVVSILHLYKVLIKDEIINQPEQNENE